MKKMKKMKQLLCFTEVHNYGFLQFIKEVTQ